MATGETTYFRIFGGILPYFPKIGVGNEGLVDVEHSFQPRWDHRTRGSQAEGHLRQFQPSFKAKMFFCHGFHLSILGDSQELFEPNALIRMNFHTSITSLGKCGSSSLMHRQAFFFAGFDLRQEHVHPLACHIRNAHPGGWC